MFVINTNNVILEQCSKSPWAWVCPALRGHRMVRLVFGDLVIIGGFDLISSLIATDIWLCVFWCITPLETLLSPTCCSIIYIIIIIINIIINIVWSLTNISVHTKMHDIAQTKDLLYISIHSFSKGQAKPQTNL